MKRIGLVIALALVASCSKTSSVPPCDRADVTQLAAQIIAEAPLNKLRGVTLNEIKIRYPTETKFQKSPPKRFCRAELETSLGREALYYSVEWQKKEQGIIWVQTLETENGE